MAYIASHFDLWFFDCSCSWASQPTYYTEKSDNQESEHLYMYWLKKSNCLRITHIIIVHEILRIYVHSSSKILLGVCQSTRQVLDKGFHGS